MENGIGNRDGETGTGGVLNEEKIDVSGRLDDLSNVVGDKADFLAREQSATKDEALATGDVPNSDVESADNVVVANGEIELRGNGDEYSAVKVNTLVRELSTIVDEDVTEDVSVDNVEGLKDNVVENGESNLRDVSETETSMRTEIFVDEDVVVDMHDDGHKDHENGVSHRGLMYLVQDGIKTIIQETQDHGLPESQDVDESEGGGADFQDEVEYNVDTGQLEKRGSHDNNAADGSVNYDNKAMEKGDGVSFKNDIQELKIPYMKTNEAQIVQLEYLNNEDKKLHLPVATIDQEEKPTFNEEISSVVTQVAERLPIEDSPKRLDNSSVEERSKALESEVYPILQDSSPKPVQSATPAPGHPHLSDRPAGLGRAAPLLEPSARAIQHPKVNGAPSSFQNQLVEEPLHGEAEEYDETREKLQMIRVKFLRLAHRLGQTPHNVVVAQVLYRLGLAEQLRGRSGSRVAAFSFDRASAMAEQLEAAGREPLDFSCTIMVLGKAGVGKSATINSIFDEFKFGTDAFHLGTKKVQDVVGTVQGIKVRVIDTPGLLSSWSDQRQNQKILHSVKRFIKKTPPDIVLYLDRLDMPSRDFSDMPLLRTITETFGPSIWFNAIVALTHAASAPPEGPSGTTSYDMFVTQRSHAVQQEIRQAAGDMRLMNPVSLVENHSACRINRAGQRVLPNGQVWKPHLLLLSFASKILAEANTLLKLQESPPGKPFATRSQAPPLPYLLSSLLQSRPQVKLPTEQFDDEDDSFDDLEDDRDSEDESEYDQLPPFKSLTKAQLSELPKDQRNAYYAELEYREKLFMKKQLKEEKLRRKMMKKMQAMVKDFSDDYNENTEKSGGAASVPVPMPDLALPSSFDSDHPTHRYRSLDSNNQWLIRPVLEPNGWDHDVGYEAINLERLFVVKEQLPISFSGQVSKDKKEANLQMEVATSIKHGEGKATSLGFDLHSAGKDIAYTLRGETRFCNYRKNKAIAGTSLTILGDTITGGVKVEDKLIVHNRGHVVVSGGAMFGRGDVAYGGSLEATLRDKDHPLGRFLSTLALSAMDYHGDFALGCNSQIQIPVGRHTNLIGRANINNRGAGQVSIRLNSSDQLQIVLAALIPFGRKLFGYWKPDDYV